VGARRAGRPDVSGQLPGLSPARNPTLARINHTFLPKFFFPERTEFRTEVTEPNTLSARCALCPGLRVLCEIG
jgi:hypothetical protein